MRMQIKASGNSTEEFGLRSTGTGELLGCLITVVFQRDSQTAFWRKVRSGGDWEQGKSLYIETGKHHLRKEPGAQERSELSLPGTQFCRQ